MAGLEGAIDAAVLDQHPRNKRLLIHDVPVAGQQLMTNDTKQKLTKTSYTDSKLTTTCGTESKITMTHVAESSFTTTHDTESNLTTTRVTESNFKQRGMGVKLTAIRDTESKPMTPKSRSESDWCCPEPCTASGVHRIQSAAVEGRECDLNDAHQDRGPESERRRRRKVFDCFYDVSQHVLSYDAVLATRETLSTLWYNLLRLQEPLRAIQKDEGKLIGFLNVGLDLVLSNKYMYDIRLNVNDKTLAQHQQTKHYSSSYHKASHLVDRETTALSAKKNEHGPSRSREQVLFKGLRRQTCNEPQRLFSLWWMLLLLLTCTGNLFNASQFQRAIVAGSLGRFFSAASGNGLLMESFGSVLTTSQDMNSVGGAMAAIIPPPWANITTNPCAMKSWQLLYWPDHDKCYKIFSQGPCHRGEEVFHDTDSNSAQCRCEKGRIKHVDTDRCYLSYSRGPCRPREFLQESSPGSGAQCNKFAGCAAGDVYWPADDTCYRQHTRGPCQHGELLHLHPDTGWPTCGCDPAMMRMQYWPHGDTCHELLSRGPCVVGHVFTYNSTTRKTQCSCSPSLTANYHRDTDQCYPLETQGPCPPGHTFSLPKGANEPMCTCLKGHLLHVPSGTCQRAYTRAVCLSGEFLEPDANEGVGVGRCASVPCKSSGQLYHPETDRCYPVGSSGPCSKGKLWVYERASSLRGRCHCDENLVGYWGPHNICYPLGERGPCPSRHVITYSSSRGLACSCDRRRGYTRWKGRCERITAADIIRDLIGSNIRKPSDDELQHSNSVMQARGRNFKHTTTLPRESTILTRSTLSMKPTTQSLPSTFRQRTTTPSFRSTTASRFATSFFGTTEMPILTTPSTEEKVDTHEIITFSRDFPNSIEGEDTQPRSDDSDIRKRIARLTHRGLITRRTRRPSN